MDHYHWLFTRNPEKDFSRIKKWSFGEILRFIISMEGKSLKDELLEHFNFSVDTISNVAVSVVGFSIVFGCNFYEKIVSGVKAVGTGQAEAARAQGFTANQTFFRILFPQALDHMAPNYESDVISLIQDTSVVGYIAVLRMFYGQLENPSKDAKVMSKNYNEGGFLTIGFVGPHASVADWYTNNGSLYMTSLAFLPLGLPENDPFWTDPAEKWTSKKAWEGDDFPKDHKWDINSQKLYWE